MKETIVLYTGAMAGHLMPMVSLAKQFIQHGFAATIVTFDTPMKPGFAAEEVARISSTNPSISFHILPTNQPDNHEGDGPANFKAILRENNTKLLEFLTFLSKTESIQAVILSFLCTMALEVTKKLGIRAYFFIAFGASALAVFLHLLEIHEINTISFKNMGRNMVHFPGIPAFPACDMPNALLDRESETYKWCLEICKPIIEGDGLLINSFESLEPKALVALREGLCLPGRKVPSIYCIGPLVKEGKEKEGKEMHETLTWLDSQPKDSVVFLCLGSMNSLSINQIKKIATGLENSGQKFLWVIKITDEMNKILEQNPDSDLETILPNGFLHRTEDRGMVVISWVPQVQILQHESVGGFVTHCGWNSTLEAITAGVPMICWPLYAEQKLNKTVLVEEIKIGVAMEGYNEETVEAEEVEKKVRWLIEEGRKTMKKLVVAVKEKAEEALREDGPSADAILQFLENLRGKNEREEL